MQEEKGRSVTPTTPPQSPGKTAFSQPAANALEAELQAGAQALGLPLLPAQSHALLAYLALMQRWNAVYNLTAVRAPLDMLRQHLLDCLAVLPPLRAHAAGIAPGPFRVLDVGSGGGLPGVVLAVLQPQWRITCVDTVAKKASFVRQVAGELGLANLQAVHARVERWRPPEPFELITSRAFASLADFVRLTQAHLGPGGVWAAMKGAHPQDELAALPEGLEMFHVEPLRVPGLVAQRCLVWLRPNLPAGAGTDAGP